jgi:heme/copper-type cytochrome/quinol oxidase subunit 4
VGAGGLASESSKGKLSTRNGYLVVSVLAIILVWAADLLEIISFASRAFALYYLLQCVVALIASYHQTEHKAHRLNQVRFTTLAGILAFIVIFAMPAK